MPAARDQVLLDLDRTARAVGRELPRRPRARLEAAVAAVLVECCRGPAAPATRDDALQQLRQALECCRRQRVAWADVVALVNREDGF